MGLKRLNMMMGDFNSNYHLEKLDNGEIVMVKNEVSRKQSQRNLLEHLKEE